MVDNSGKIERASISFCTGVNDPTQDRDNGTYRTAHIHQTKSTKFGQRLRESYHQRAIKFSIVERWLDRKHTLQRKVGHPKACDPFD